MKKKTGDDERSGWKEIGRTSVIHSTRNPDFPCALDLEHYIGNDQTLRFSLIQHSGHQREVEAGYVEIDGISPRTRVTRA